MAAARYATRKSGFNFTRLLGATLLIGGTGAGVYYYLKKKTTTTGGCTTCNCLTCPQLCTPTQCQCGCDCKTCPSTCPPCTCLPAKQAITSVYPNPSYQFQTVRFQATGFMCNDAITGIILYGGFPTQQLTATSDGSGNVSGAFNNGLALPGGYLLVLKGYKGGQASYTFQVI